VEETWHGITMIFSLNGAFNIKLYNINQQRDRDDLIYALYGEIPSGNTYASDSNQNFLTFCSVLNDFASHDCIVPSRSAILDGNPLRDRKKDRKFMIIVILTGIPILFVITC
jgi:hypothetical protein